LARRYFEFLGKRTKQPTFEKRAAMKFIFWGRI
jgi:hypothetical protein